MKKKLPPPAPHTQNLKEKKSRHFECMLSLPIGCMKFLFPKLFVTIFGLAYFLSSKTVRYGLRDTDFYVYIKDGIFVIVKEI
jgi:hypothetical protein